MNEKLKLLLAEDDETQRLYLSSRLQSAGFAVTSVEQGDHAIQRARAQRFDAIISDIEMPGSNGLEVVRELAGDNSVILVSGAVTPEARRRAMADGAVAVLHKPVAWKDLQNVLGKVLERTKRKPRALVADDHEASRLLLSTVLEKEGYDVDLAEDGEVALELIEGAERPYDLLITDILMPKLEGPELIQRTRGSRDGTRVVFTTGAGSRDDVRRCYAQGGVAFWKKPLDVKRVTAEVRRWKETPAPAAGPEPDVAKLTRWWHRVRHDVEQDKEKKIAVRKGIVFITTIVLLVVVLSTLDFVREMFGGALGRVDSFMERMEGYLERDEMRELERERMRDE